MFSGLGGNALIGSNHQQHSVNPANTSQHVADEIAVARGIHNADLFSIWQLKSRKTEFYCHFPLDFLFEAIGMYPGEGCNQCGFAVINVAGSPNDVHGFTELSSPLKELRTEWIPDKPLEPIERAGKSH